MPDANALSGLAERLHVDFTGPVKHETVAALARAWLPDINFHEVEMYYPIDLEELYTVPAELFATFDPLVQQEFAMTVGGVTTSPPIVRVGDTLQGAGTTADDALLEPDVDGNAVYSHGGSLRAADKFFGSETTKDGSDVAGVGNPRLPRHPLRVRVELRMLLETLENELALRAEVPTQKGDAIWGDFDVTDLLLRRFQNNRDAGAASVEVRHTFTRDLIREFKANNLAGVELLLQNPPLDGLTPTKANRTVWLALSTCGLLQYYFVYAYNDFSRYGGLFTNEHEGDNEGCCLVFERLALQELQQEPNGDPRTVAPLGIITSVHNESNRADEVRAIDADPGDARDGLDVFVARGSHATYLTPGTHDFFDISDLARESAAVVLIGVLFPPLILLLMIYEHFNGDPDETSDNGVSGQHEVDPASDPETHLPVNLVVTPLSNIDDDENIYRMPDPPPEALAAPLVLRAFHGRLGAHNSIKDKSPVWDNKTRRYFEKLVAALESGTFRPPRAPVVIL